MELKINYNHENGSNTPERLGSTNERWDEIKALWKESESLDECYFNSQRIEWVLSQLKDVQPCDLVIVGYMFG